MTGQAPRVMRSAAEKGACHEPPEHLSPLRPARRRDRERATGLLLIAGADPLTGLLGLPVTLMREAGLLLVPYVALVAFVGTRETISRPAVQAIIALNVLW